MSQPETEVPPEDTTEEFTLDETRRLAAIEAAKSVNAGNLDEFLNAAQRVEIYLRDGTTVPPEVSNPLV